MGWPWASGAMAAMAWPTACFSASVTARSRALATLPPTTGTSDDPSRKPGEATSPGSAEGAAGPADPAGWPARATTADVARHSKRACRRSRGGAPCARAAAPAATDRVRRATAALRHASTRPPEPSRSDGASPDHLLDVDDRLTPGEIRRIGRALDDQPPLLVGPRLDRVRVRRDLAHERVAHALERQLAPMDDEDWGRAERSFGQAQSQGRWRGGPATRRTGVGRPDRPPASARGVASDSRQSPNETSSFNSTPPFDWYSSPTVRAWSMARRDRGPLEMASPAERQGPQRLVHPGATHVARTPLGAGTRHLRGRHSPISQRPPRARRACRAASRWSPLASILLDERIPGRRGGRQRRRRSPPGASSEIDSAVPPARRRRDATRDAQRRVTPIRSSRAASTRCRRRRG